MICKLKVQDYRDRRDLVAILATAGYRVSVEVKSSNSYSLERNEYFVVVEEKSDGA